MEEPISNETIENFVELARQAVDMARVLNCSVEEGMRVIMTTFQAIQKVNYANAKVGRGPMEVKESSSTETPEKPKPNLLSLIPFPGKH